MTTTEQKEKAAARARVRYQKNKQAYKDRAKEWKQENLHRIRNKRQEVRGTKEGIWDLDAWHGVVSSMRHRAKKHNIPFNITAKYLASITPEFCPVLGIPLLRSTNGGATRNSPSVDRIVPELGYVEGNVIVVSMLANSVRSSATPDEIEAVATFYRRLLAARPVDIATWLCDTSYSITCVPTPPC